MTTRSYAGTDVFTDVTDGTIVVVPLGAHEQHGPHLPFETDTLIAHGICQRLDAALTDALDIRFLPAEPIGYSPEHMDFAGSQTLTWSETVERWLSVGTDCASRGVRRIVFMNAHGGNVPIVQIVCQELRARHGMLAVATKWDRFVKGTGIVSADEEMFGIHGGQVETSVMLALHPELVAMEATEDFDNMQAQLSGNHLRAYGAHSFGWMAQDLNAQGVTGHAAAASAETGEVLLTKAVSGLAELVHDVADFDLALLRQPPALS